MDTSGLGGGIMLAIAAALWMLYLLPSWLRRRDLSHVDRHVSRIEREERAAARLARIEQARAERIAHQEARMISRQAPSSSPPAAVPSVVSTPPVAAQRSVALSGPARPFVAPRGAAPRYARASSLAHRRRRARLIATLALSASAVALVVQVSLIVTTGAVVGSWLVLAVAASAAFGAVWLLNRLAVVARPAAAPVARRTSLGYSEPLPATAPAVEPSWTPVPIPKPLYLSHAPAQPAATADALAELTAAAAAAERALRSAHAEPEVAELPQPVPATAAVHSRFSSMGVVDAAASEHPDLDAVLRRRRSAG